MHAHVCTPVYSPHNTQMLKYFFHSFSNEIECGRREIKLQRGRLNYLAPEILKELAPPCPHKGASPITYSTASDIYAFRYVVCAHLILVLWYVILCYKSHEELFVKTLKPHCVGGNAEMSIKTLRKYPGGGP